MIYIGTAGWSLPKEIERGEALLQEYAKRLNVVEINRTFYKLPRASTFARWAQMTPQEFRFILKLHRSFTHINRLKTDGLEEFCVAIAPIKEKLLALLVQLPPSLEYRADRAEKFFRTLVTVCSTQIVCEPRHRSWVESEELFRELHIARVAADPPRYEIDKEPGGWQAFCYYRLHGSPKIYYSAYGEPFLFSLAQKLRASKALVKVVIFDNTTKGAAFFNALQLKEIIDET